MIRRRDQIRLSVQKLALRKKRAAFSIVSVALGVIVVVAVDSLIQNVRDLLLKTNFTEDIDKDVVRVYANVNPYESVSRGQAPEENKTKRSRFLTETTFEEIRGWPEVEAAACPITAQPLGLDAFAGRPQPPTQCTGVPEPLLKRYAKDAGLLAACSNAIPMVVGERNLRLRYDAARKKFALEAESNVNAWIGRDVTITLGDNYAGMDRFQYDYEKKQWNELSKEDVEQQRDMMQRNLHAQYDAAVMDSTLMLKGRIVGLCPGRRVLIRLDTAVSCEKWITQRRELASLYPSRRTEELQYGARGRRTAKAGEYTEGIVLVKEGADTEAVAKRISDMGFQATTRARAFESFVKELDTGIRFVKRIAFAFGGIILGIAGGLLWSTTSRIVSDSRVDIGLFRALGATKRDIRRLFLSEAMLLGLLGTLAGMFLGWTVAFYVSRWVIRAVRGDLSDPEQLVLLPDSIFSVDVRFCILLLAGAAVLSLVAGLLPAARAARIDPVKALKRE